MRVTGFRASQRSKKGWKTRRSRNPSQYGNVITKRGTTYWKRPNGQKVKLKGFSKRDIRKIKPALAATDQHLKPGVRPEVKVIKKTRRTGSNLAEYRRGPVRRPQIVINNKAFRRTHTASGLLQHEIGHSLYSGVNASKTRNKQFRQDFGYRKKIGRPEHDLQRYTAVASNQIAKKKTRQGVDAAEDFAETYRHLTGQRVSRRRYWSVDVDEGRNSHLHKHYLR